MTDTFDSKTCPQSPQEQYSDIVIEGGGGRKWHIIPMTNQRDDKRAYMHTGDPRHAP